MHKLLYPRGFVALPPVGQRSSANVYDRSEGDEVITRLFYQSLRREVNTTAWSYRRQVIEQAALLFGDFREWLRLQVQNPYLHGYNYAFLQDTLTHLTRLDQRSMTVNNWLDLSTLRPEKDEAFVQSKLGSQFLADHDWAKTETVLSRWCLYEGGFEDLLQSLYLMFGAAKVKE